VSDEPTVTINLVLKEGDLEALRAMAVEWRTTLDGLFSAISSYARQRHPPPKPRPLLKAVR
jgi:hypothetical protein